MGLMGVMGVIWGMNKIMPSAKYYAAVGLMLNGRHVFVFLTVLFYVGKLLSLS